MGFGKEKVESFVNTVKTDWGQWSQSIDEVTLEINIEPVSSSKEIKCIIKTDSISVAIRNESIIEGKLYSSIIGDDSFWTLEDKKLVRVVLHKRELNDKNIWKSLLANNEYPVEAAEWENVEKKLSLERFQRDITDYVCNHDNVLNDNIRTLCTIYASSLLLINRLIYDSTRLID